MVSKEVLAKEAAAKDIAAKEAAAKEALAKATMNNSNFQRQSSHHRDTPPPHSKGLAGAVNNARSTGVGLQSGHIKSNLTPDLSQQKPVNADPKNFTAGLPANLVNLLSKGGHHLSEVPKQAPAAPTPPKVDTETPAQKKAALRKHLEKTLLQIPPPKPPPSEMHFIPNPSNTEFICLMGLEECVKVILKEDKENTNQPVPFSCSQCGTDFTTAWKWDESSKDDEVKVLCENCVTSNVKKALKAEHTNRLKAAFVKALQQEKELEADMAAQSAREAAASKAAAAAAATAAATAAANAVVTSGIRTHNKSSDMLSRNRQVKLLIQNFTTRWGMLTSQLILCSFQPHWHHL